MTTVEEAFRNARIHAVRHMAACEDADLRWGETSITEIVMAQAAAAVTVVPFTQRAEAVSGADWIWWWVDGSGSYGMLVQAKRVTVAGGTWRFDFSYPGGAGSQRAALMGTASALGLLPVYGLFLGTGSYRNWEPCPDGHRRGRCLRCVRRSISFMPALLADHLVDNSRTTYDRSVALEGLWKPVSTRPLLISTVRRGLPPSLADFLLGPQRGTRAITRSMIDRVLAVRMTQFSLIDTQSGPAVRDGAHDRLGPIFDDFPSDTGHWGVNYFEHTLRPLRHAPPDYVLELESRDVDPGSLAADLRESVAGIVVVRPPQGD